jgi:two-component system, response regulator FlrC
VARPPHTPGLRILVVEDDDDVRESLVDVLAASMPDAVVTAVGSAEDGLEAIRGTAFTAAISDYKLPGLDGLGFLRLARERVPATARILITAFPALEVELHEVDEARLDAVLTKPLDLADFVAHVRAAVRRASSPGPSVRETGPHPGRHVRAP